MDTHPRSAHYNRAPEKQIPMNDQYFGDTQLVSLIRLVEVTKVPAEGTVVQHEVILEQPTLVDGTIRTA